VIYPFQFLEKEVSMENQRNKSAQFDSVNQSAKLENQNRTADSVCRNLKFLSDQELDTSLKTLVRKENQVLSEILLHIREVAGRRLYLKLNYGSLFDYLTEHLGYANGPAQRRIDAARLSNEVPTLIADLKAGDLNLSQVALVQKCARERRKEHEKLKKAGLETEAELKADLGVEVKAQLLQSLKQKSFVQSQVIVSKAFEVEVQSKPKLTYQADGSVRLEVTFSKEQWGKLERMRSLISHSLPDGSWEQVLESVADRVIASKTKTRAGSKLKAQTGLMNLEIEVESSKASQDPSRDRIFEGAEVDPKLNGKKSYYQCRKDLFQQYHSCQHVDRSTKEKCASSWKLQAEHIIPKWAGGSDSPENLTVLCAEHNRQKYREQAGIRMQ
jgi:hypothetical protein